MTRQYVSICGHSAVGKKTLIRRLLADDPPMLRERFGLAGSVQAYGLWGEVRPLVEILDAKEDSVLHFWQDDSHEWIGRLGRKFPEARHRVILLWRPWDIHRDALLARNNEYKPSIENLEHHWQVHITRLFRGIEASGVEFELVNAATPRYDKMAWPKLE